MEQKLFNGEVIIRQDGCYTRAHFFRHQETGQRALLVGMMHGGDPECFAAIKELLSECDCVLYEGSASSDNRQNGGCENCAGSCAENPGDISADAVPGERIECAKHCSKTCGECSGRDANNEPAPAMALMQIFFIAAPRHLGLSLESDFFDYHAAGWKSAEGPFIARMRDDEEFRKELLAQLMAPAISKERQNEICLHLLEAITRIAEREFSRKDFMESFAFLWSDGETVEAFQSILGAMRDEIVFDVFDETVRHKNPNMIGIKFGAAHIAHQRQLLERRGYVIERSIEIKQFLL